MSSTTDHLARHPTPSRPPAPLERRALELIDESDLVGLTQLLIRQPGQNPPGQEAATVAALVGACLDHDLAVRTSTAADGRDNVHATTRAGEGPGLLLLGHTDVVPIGEGWTVDPIDGVVRDGRIFGRGSTDMLGGLAACVIAMSAVQRAAAETQTALTGPIELAATVDEEEGGLGIRHLMQESHPPYLGCITAEPTDLQTIIAARGDCYLDITVHGVAAHSGRPSDGCNAIYGAARIIESLRAWHDELASHAHPLAGAATWSVGQVDGGQGTAIVPARCRVQADRRLLPGEDPAQVLESVRQRIATLRLQNDGLSFEIVMPMSMPGFDTSATDPFPVAVDAALAESGGPGLPLGGWTAACDGGYIACDLGVPTVVLGPGSVNDQAHRPDESVAIAELLVAARTYALTAARLLGPGNPRPEGD
ncbi:M20 family metallopeptidase [Leekyejoonella antrihumi]|uniref:M20 family metallopeptidase n=1 Tax=Leekyejoonella antrihumi TaxID=1660198 RepID=A0A563E0G6_9MICO|nr:M20 family metallopeptidase [Leekyejoonella antrihumi]TWP35713.1 M20 family metallopeptidase [Leekyejoonella antrihumi]